MARARAALTGPPRRIGVTNLRFRLGANTFTIYGQNIGLGAVSDKTVFLTANNHLWTVTSIANAGNDGLTITAKCSKKKHKPHHAGFGTFDADDDLTVTITFYDVTPTDTVDCTFTDVEYDP